ncbi:MAG TPA: ROK family protein, partial [Chthoniobacteraceae bacterium]|nr:ROK family protein [Chthoniobacteraceae bacterium]
AIGIDLGGTSMKSALVVEGEIVHRGNPIDTQSLGGPIAIIDAMVGLVGQLGEHGKPVAAIGIGLPGLVDSVNGIVHELTNVPGWEETPLRQIMRQRTGLPVTIENDAKAMAYGEWKYGAAKSGRHVICITLGTGVGGGLIIEGKIYRGAKLAAGEIGHMSIDYRGRRGPYGNFGGLEEYIGNHQIAERAQERYRDAGRELTLEQCSPRCLAELANNGDAIAKQMWEDLGDELGAALASVVWIINPDTIVIGGGVAKAGELLFDPVRRSIRARTLDIIHNDLRIVPAALGNDAGIIGNAALAIEAATA